MNDRDRVPSVEMVRAEEIGGSLVAHLPGNSGGDAQARADYCSIDVASMDWPEKVSLQNKEYDHYFRVQRVATAVEAFDRSIETCVKNIEAALSFEHDLTAEEIEDLRAGTQALSQIRILLKGGNHE